MAALPIHLSSAPLKALSAARLWLWPNASQPLRRYPRDRPHLVRRKADLCAADKLVRLDDLERYERRDSLPPKLTYTHTVSFASAEVTFRAVTVSFAS